MDTNKNATPNTENPIPADETVSTTTPSTQNTAPSNKGFHKKKDMVSLFTEEQTNIIDDVQKRMNMAFFKFVHEKKWKNVQIAEEFYPYISGESAVSKIMNGTQLVSLEMILVMALRFGQPLDEILLGRKQTGYTLTPGDITYLSDLVKKASQFSDSTK